MIFSLVFQQRAWLVIHMVLHCYVQPGKTSCYYKQMRREIVLEGVNVANRDKMTQLTLYFRGIISIEPDALLGFKNLIYLDLRENSITSLDMEIFKDLKSLKTLYLNQNSLKHILNGTFSYLTSLEDLNLKFNCIKQIYRGSFLGLSSLRILNLRVNLIHKVENRSFGHLTSLETLHLESNALKELNSDTFLGSVSLKYIFFCANKLHHLAKGTFKYTSSLKRLYLNNTNLKQLNREILEGLESLEYLSLNDNKLQKLGDKCFRHLASLIELDLSDNQLTQIHSLYFPDSKLHKIGIRFNELIKCTFSFLYPLNILLLDNNNLTEINDIMFARLTNLTYLDLSCNYIHNIDINAFKDLISLKYLNLKDNRLTQSNDELFTSIMNLNILILQKKAAYNTSLMNPKSKAQDKLQVDLQRNKISLFSWTVLTDFTADTRQNMTYKNSFSLISLSMDEHNFKCNRRLCWIKHLKWDMLTWREDDRDHYFKCISTLKIICPNQVTWCMYSDNDTCEGQCTKAGEKGGQLVIDGDVCPFQHLCQCTCDPCEEECEAKGKIHIHGNIDKFGCSICNCQCDENLNCWETCHGGKFVLKNTTFGCQECKCLCPDIDCDANCYGKGVGLVKWNENNCTVCFGCRYKKLEEDSSKLVSVLVPSMLSTLMLSFIIVLIIYLHKRSTDKKISTDLQPCMDVSDILTQNLDPEVAQEIKQNWIDSKMWYIQRILGHGQYGLVWSGVLERLNGGKLPVAIKVAKADYKDTWVVQTKWNSDNQLKAHFTKKQVQVGLNNQAVEDLLKEALVMTRFNHPNVLRMFGISVHENKPCILLPLMSNGDLKKYLRGNKFSITNQDLTSFALGIAKGMAYLAEERFVHCDLAARNCMLNSNMVVKVSDFGMAQPACDEHNRSDDMNKPLPIRWMSIEAIKSIKFTVQSDVWSYGVVLWEIYSFGELPYKGIDHADVLLFLCRGHRLRKPSACDNNIYSIMQKCWNHDPDERPGFNTIIESINKIADKEADYTEVQDDAASNSKQQGYTAEMSKKSISELGDPLAEVLAESSFIQGKIHDSKGRKMTPYTYNDYDNVIICKSEEDLLDPSQ